MSTRDNVHPINDADLDAHRDSANFMQERCQCARRITYDVLAELRKLPGVGGYLLNEPVNTVLHAIRQAVPVCELYEELSNTIDPRQAAFLGSFALFWGQRADCTGLPMPQRRRTGVISQARWAILPGWPRP
ncbi:MAG: hypothetical protein U0074_08480 [Kouleothrix sp.]